MFKNHLKIALRNLWKNKTFSLVNLLGLSVAFASSLLLFLNAFFELSYDSFHENGDRIFRIVMKDNLPDGASMGRNMPPPFAPALKAEVPDIEYVTRHQENRGTVAVQDKKIEESLDFVDADYLQMFSFQLLKGNPKTALSDLSSVVLREDVAKSIFGDQDPMNKPIRIFCGGIDKTFVVSGILQKPPRNSQLRFDILTRFENNPTYQESKDRWDYFNHSVFIEVKSNTTLEAVERKLKPFTKKYYAESIKQLQNEGVKPDERGEVRSLRLQPLSDIHFNAMLRPGNPYLYVYMLFIISGLIVVIASVNFVNLSVARSLTRAKEVGMRRVLGAMKWQIIGQFWGEAILICLASFAVGLLLVNVIYEIAFKTRILSEMHFNPWILSALLFVFLSVTILAGAYPAWLISRLETILVLKGKITAGKSHFVRNGLIVLQFSIAILLIISTIVISEQLRFFRNMPLGFNAQEVVSIPVGNVASGSEMLTFLQNELGNRPEILSISAASYNFGRGEDGSVTKSVTSFKYKDGTVAADNLTIGYDFLKTMDLKLVAGRDFS
ncbi:MAG: ABC transporter permease, partial [Verrucomicrobia bacterium]|nr:ABC transporter permease [Cytophagales bacterium]